MSAVMHDRCIILTGLGLGLGLGGEGVNDESYTDLSVDKWTKWSDSISEFNPPHTEAKPTHMVCVHILGSKPPFTGAH